MTSHQSVNSNRLFGGPYCLHLQGIPRIVLLIDIGCRQLSISHWSRRFLQAAMYAFRFLVRSDSQETPRLITVCARVRHWTAFLAISIQCTS